MSENKKASCLDSTPTPYQNILEFKELAKVYDIEVKSLLLLMNELYNNCHIGSLNEYGCERWENILGLKTNSSYTLEDRNFNIKSKYLGFVPYTLERIKNILNELVGNENYSIDFNEHRNHMDCKLNLGRKKQLDAVIDLLENTIPLNISLSVNLLYNIHSMLEVKTHGELEAYTHEQLKEGDIS